MVTETLLTDLKKIKRKMTQKKDFYRRFIAWAKRHPIKPSWFIKTAHSIESATNCTTCGHCCKTMHVPLLSRDMVKIAKHLKISVEEFKKTYTITEKKEARFKSSPCPFFKNNLCSIYEIRPYGCRGYPFLQEKAALDYRLSWLTEHAAECPIVYNTLEKTSEDYRLHHQRTPAV